jgi:hypothetical protein
MVMPGESQGCVGCHERRTESAGPRHGALTAMNRPASPIEPFAGVPEVFDYPRDIQPIWDRHCVNCHGTEDPQGRVLLTGDDTEWFTQSYAALCAYDQLSRPTGWSEDGNRPPYSFGTAASPLMKKIDGTHYTVKLSSREYDYVRLWIETGAPFTGTYAVFNHPEAAVATPLVVSKPVLGKPLEPIVQRRCLACHESVARLGRRSKEQRDDQWIDGKPPAMLNMPLYCWNLYNLSRPDQSMILRASLAKEVGGYEWCKTKDGLPAPAFRDTADPDYRAILEAIQAAKARMEAFGRPSKPGFRPGDYYVRWMKRFGVLPESFDLDRDPIDVYQTDAAYWRSLWYQGR